MDQFQLDKKQSKKLAKWQHKYYKKYSVAVSFIPTGIGDVVVLMLLDAKHRVIKSKDISNYDNW